MEDEQYNEIKNVKIDRPHIVILGAGASLAAFPEGDKYGNRLPLMNNLVEIIGLLPIFQKHGVEIKNSNFESIFSDIYKNSNSPELINELEDAIYDYFSKLELPDNSTIYDYLVLSLRAKDVIATFNWDPLLFQAVWRNHKVAKMPHIIFLHGNTGTGYCLKCKVKGPAGHVCNKCGAAYQNSKLLYPVEHKDYTSDLSIAGEWNMVQKYLEQAYMVTIFGYSAPKTDIEAIKLLKSAWGKINDRSLEQFEIIHKPDSEEDGVIKPWADFIHTHHYQLADNYFNSWLAKHPRRTCDAMWSQLMDVVFLDDNLVQQNLSLSELQDWHKELINNE